METIINSIEELKSKALNRDLSVYIKLKGGMKSSKEIYFNEEQNIFEVFSSIDGKSQAFTEEQLKTNTNIVDAINNKVLIIE